MNSIRVRLLRWLIGPILLINIAGAALAYVLAWTPAQLAFDQGLGDAASALLARLKPGPGRPLLDLPEQAEQVLRTDATDAIYFVVRDGGGRLVAGDADFPALAGAAAAPAYDGVMRAEPVRIGTLTARVGPHTVQIGVAKTLRKRLQVRAAIVRALLLLEGMFTLALVGLIWLSVTNGLKPLWRLRADLNARAGDELAPIEAGQVPYELAPVVTAFNGLLGKVRAGARAQQDFLADVAHQLRTPLAGLALQLEWLSARHANDPESVHSIRLMLLAGERMIRQTKQLLALARAEPAHFEKARLGQLDLAALVQESIQYFVEEAGKKGIDIGFDLEPTMVAGERFLLRDLVDNLVDNAVRYTPPGGTVTVRVRAEGGAGLLRVEDSGPGIAPHRRVLVFNRYVRLDEKSSGSGLGLAIVRDIALAHGAEIALGDHAGGAGLVVTVRFPRA
ncbi:sensor histidine kinase [Massilia glaciei]|uniref:histidine kinase n=1 Tax=Massilia glaciei TaxID=1524097 RepID=A0A2U2HE37_9BURK|nr:sensor histidine kinase [Massilia glaciei]PWF41592.1 sensor histidine kinase [Massilia glaciei]